MTREKDKMTAYGTKQIALTFGGKVTHIGRIDDEGRIKTLCGRLLKNYSLNTWANRLCPRCGNQSDFDTIRAEVSKRQEKYAASQKAKREKQKEADQRKLLKHRAIMSEFAAQLESGRAENVNCTERASGGRIELEFEIDGLKFKLSGSIW